MTEQHDEPVAWLHHCKGMPDLLALKPLTRGAGELGWTETPLYTRPTPSSDMVEAMARLSSDNEGLREMLRIVEDPDRQLCCSGYQCGCMGSTVGQYAAWAFRDTAAKDAQLAERDREIEALQGALGRIEGLYGRTPSGAAADMAEAAIIARAALGSAEG